MPPTFPPIVERNSFCSCMVRCNGGAAYVRLLHTEGVSTEQPLLEVAPIYSVAARSRFGLWIVRRCLVEGSIAKAFGSSSMMSDSLSNSELAFCLCSLTARRAKSTATRRAFSATPLTLKGKFPRPVPTACDVAGIGSSMTTFLPHRRMTITANTAINRTFGFLFIDHDSSRGWLSLRLRRPSLGFEIDSS